MTNVVNPVINHPHHQPFPVLLALWHWVPVYHSFTSIYFDVFPIKTSIYRGLTMTTPSFFSQPTSTPPNQPRHPNRAVKNCRPAASQSMRWACTLPLATAHWATRPTPKTGRWFHCWADFSRRFLGKSPKFYGNTVDLPIKNCDFP
jgi:hypothetical protein